MLVALVFTLVTLVAAATDRLCSSSIEGSGPYTGFKVFKSVSLGWPVLHHWHVVHCKKGKLDLNEFFLASREENFLWNVDLCIADERCFRFVRRQRYAARRVPIFASNQIIGGLFKDEVPLLPVLSSSSNNRVVYRKNHRVVLATELLYTPDVGHPKYPKLEPSGEVEWLQDVNPHEVYNGTNGVWDKTNKLLNGVVEKLTMGDKWIPWEFEYEVKE